MKSIFLNPFERYAEKVLIPIGLLALILGSLLGAVCASNFDGVLDLHFSNYQLSFYELLLQNVINVSVLALLLFGTGKILNSKTRLVDLIVAALISRIPLYFMSLFNVSGKLTLNQSQDLNEMMEFAQSNMTFLIIMSIVMIVVLVWMVILLFKGYLVATNGKGAKSIVFFVLAILLAEIISKYIIYTLIL